MTLINKNNEPKGEAAALMACFKHPEQSTQSFNEELKRLTPEAKTELAMLAAIAMGWTVINP